METALKLYNNALESIEKTEGKKSIMYPVVITNIGKVYSKIGNPKLAKNYYTEALIIRKEILGEANPKYLKSLWNAYLIEEKEGQFENSDDLIKQIVYVTQKIYGDSSHEYLDALDNYGYFLLKMGRTNEAGVVWSNAFDKAEAKFGLYSTICAKFAYSIGYGAVAEGSFKEAKRMFEIALEIELDSLNSDDNLIWKYKLGLAEAYRGLGEYQNAFNSINDLKKDTIRFKEHYGVITNNLASIYEDLGEYNLAGNEYLKSISFYQMEKRNERLVSGFFNLGKLYLKIDSIKKKHKLFD
jgi:tetratricopeptide (TPR) repeat protein